MSTSKVLGSSVRELNSDALICLPLFDRSKLFSVSPSATIFFLIFTFSFKKEKSSCSTATFNLISFKKRTESKFILNSLNNGVLKGRFQREHVINGKWIMDFFFPDIRLAIEVDGSTHYTNEQRLKDAAKEADCEALDITILRIRNREVFGNREHLVNKLRTGWRGALNRENRIIGKVR